MLLLSSDPVVTWVAFADISFYEGDRDASIASRESLTLASIGSPTLQGSSWALES